MANSSGWFDEQGSVTVARDPINDALDVFTEDNYNLRIGWYQVNDGGVTELVTGGVTDPPAPPAPASLAATAAPRGRSCCRGQRPSARADTRSSGALAA